MANDFFGLKQIVAGSGLTTDKWQIRAMSRLLKTKKRYAELKK